MAGATFLTLVTPAYAKNTSLIFTLACIVDVVLWMIVGADAGWYGDPLVFKPVIGWAFVVCGFMVSILLERWSAIPYMAKRYSLCRRR